MPTEKNTFYFGRYSLAVPTDGNDIWSSYEVVKKRIEFISKNGRRDLPKSTAEIIATITRKHNAGYTDAYDHTLPLDGGGAIVISKGYDYSFYIFYLTEKILFIAKKSNSYHSVLLTKQLLEQKN
ncbi:hypothetical protein [Pseudomonas putida]|uniref:hypothetical protein n=1 Tax=Pseudomonas putida TaxID=303 RepID=UPI00300EC8D2